MDGITISTLTVTIYAMSVSAGTWLLVSWAHAGEKGSTGKAHASKGMCLTAGTLAGLIIMLPFVGWVGPMAAVILGIIAGISGYVAYFLKNRNSLEDTSTIQIIMRGTIWFGIIVIPLNFWFVSSMTIHFQT